MATPLLVMLAGPNGAGKSTFYEAYLKRLGLPFLNADVLARETGLDAYEAARTIAAIRDGCIERRESFVTETVFSDPQGEKVAVLGRAAEAGFDVTGLYGWFDRRPYRGDEDMVWVCRRRETPGETAASRLPARPTV